MSAKKDNLMNFYKSELSAMLSDLDFQRYFPDVERKLMKYSQLAQYASISDLFPGNQDDYKIILIESEKNSGHWVSLMKVGKELTFFDSYGIYPDDELNFISKMKNRLLGQGRQEIRRLMKTGEKIKFKCFFSKTKYQSDNQNVNSCGRWVCLSVHMLYQQKYSLPEMKKIIDEVKKTTGKPYDIIVVDFTT
jgi:hypothetical protein